MNLKERRERAAFKNTEPTQTDQSAAATTDLNVIINQFLKTGQSSSRGNPAYGDFSELPTDLRGMIDQAKTMKALQRQLPPQLKDMRLDELINLTPQDLARILAPAEKPADKPADKPTETTKT